VPEESALIWSSTREGGSC